jgi:hypothetical protein
MVIPLTHVVLILKEKNKRRTMMNNIKNTMCRLSELSRWEIDSLVDAMPPSVYLEQGWYPEKALGFDKKGNSGFWNELLDSTIVTYTEMMQLLKGKDMNKQTAQEQIAVMQIEMDKLKAIIDKQEAKPEAKTGRVMGLDDIEDGDTYWLLRADIISTRMDSDTVDKARIDMGNAFHDRETAEKYLEYLKLEQELRRAQIADGGAGDDLVIVIQDNRVVISHSVYFHKVSFRTVEARNNFRTAHTDEQLTLLIRGV